MQFLLQPHDVGMNKLQKKQVNKKYDWIILSYYAEYQIRFSTSYPDKSLPLSAKH